MKSPNIQYDYIVHNIGEAGAPAYKAVIPALNGIVFGDNLTELEAGISLMIEEELKARAGSKGKKQTIPAPDRLHTYSGKFVVRLNPSLHEKLALEAKARGKSLNAYFQEKVLA